MKKTFVRIIDDKEIPITTEMDFTDAQGNRHARQVLWLWSEEELWDVLNIKVIWLNEVSDIITESLPDVRVKKKKL